MKYQIEICANSIASCIAAQNGGAERVELCAGMSEGGTTPSYGEVITARERLNIQLHTIIRPRGGDFLYSKLEHQVMCKDIEIMYNIGVNGIVIGCLTKDGEVDMKQNKALITAAKGMSITFHRAFDMCKNPMESLEKIIDLGCHRILTSGQMTTAQQGTKLIQQLVQKANGRITIMPGGGINQQNIIEIAQQTQATEFHLSARSNTESQMIYRNPKVNIRERNITTDEYYQKTTNPLLVKQIINMLKNKSL